MLSKINFLVSAVARTFIINIHRKIKKRTIFNFILKHNTIQFLLHFLTFKNTLAHYLYKKSQQNFSFVGQ